MRKRLARAGLTRIAQDWLGREAASRAEETFTYLTRFFPRVLVMGDAPFTPPANCGTVIRASAIASPGTALVMDEESPPFAEASFDAVICLMGLHWVNELPRCLAHMHRLLTPDGLFLAIFPGGESLRELRQVFAEVETARFGGVFPRIPPFLDVRDGGALLQRAGFALPVADRETLTISYADFYALAADIRAVGEVNMLRAQAHHPASRGFFDAVARRYAATHHDAEGRIPATLELITLSGWKPAASQQAPARRGSGQVSLVDVLGPKA